MSNETINELYNKLSISDATSTSLPLDYSAFKTLGANSRTFNKVSKIGISFLLLAATSNAVVSYQPLFDGTTYTSTTVQRSFTQSRKRVSIAEARQIAARILKEAEARRIQRAQREAMEIAEYLEDTI